MRYIILYVFALYLLGWSVRKMIEEAEAKAMLNIDEAERVAWSKGFDRGTRSVEVQRTPKG